jgi:hypothetical protein
VRTRVRKNPVFVNHIVITIIISHFGTLRTRVQKASARSIIFQELTRTRSGAETVHYGVAVLACIPAQLTQSVDRGQEPLASKIGLASDFAATR